MNYIQIDKYDTANGKGIGTVLWIAGCEHNCLGCHNPQTHSPEAGQLFTQDTLKEVLETLGAPHITRLTFSGGDPLFPANRIPIFQIALTVKLHYPNINIWLYTGYLYEEVKDLPIMHLIDVLVDGKFELGKRDLTLDFRGSSNQRIIHLKEGKPIIGGFAPDR